MKCVIYARFSPRPGESNSIDTQVAECEQYARTNGWHVLSVHSDSHASGADPEREGLWEAMDNTPRGGVLLVWKMDRLARDLYLAEALHRQADKRGFRVQAVREGVADDTAEGRLIRQVLAAAAEYERRLVQVRTSVAMKRYQNQGRRMSRHAPFGWVVDSDDPTRIVPDQREQAALDYIYRMRKDGYGWRAICTNLALAGHKPRGKTWDASSVRRIVKRSQQRTPEHHQPESSPSTAHHLHEGIQ